MPEPGSKVNESPRRALIDDLLMKGMPPKRIVRYMREMYNEQFTEKAISDYRTNFFRSDNGIVNQIIKASQDLADKEHPPTSDREMLASYFTFKKTRDDLDIIYERIRAVRKLANEMPFDDNYDKRLVLLFSQAESIRNRVFRHQYEQIRKAILLNIGKKICMAAINVFLVYIPTDRRKEAVERFEALVKPMLGLTAIPEEPEDIAVAKEGAVDPLPPEDPPFPEEPPPIEEPPDGTA